LATALPSFRQAAARHKNGNAYQRAFTPGAPLYIPLNRQGYLNRLWVNYNGLVTVGTVGVAGDVPDTASLINFFPLMAIKSPQGDYIHSYTSRSLFEFNFRLHPAVVPGAILGQTPVAGIVDPTFTGINTASATAQAVNINFEMPIGLNDGLNFDTGMLMRQVANNDFTLQLTCAGFTDLYGPNNTLSGTATHFTITAITGTVFIEEEWYEAVDPRMVAAPDFHSIIKLRDQIQSPLVIGDNYIPYSLGPTLLDMVHRVILNNQGDTTNGVALNYLKVLVNKQVEIENRRGADVRRDNFYHLMKLLPNGVFHLDFFDDSNEVNVTRARDFINSNLASQLDTVINVSAGTTLVNAQVSTTYRELVTLGA